jgi:hypothetical protein
MRIIKTAVVLSAFVLSLTLNAQDKILMNSGKEIKAWIIEKSDTEIKYKILDSEESPMIVIKTAKVEKITFRNGQELATVPDVVRMQKRFGVGGGLMVGVGIESAFFKLQADYFVTPAISIEFDGLMEVEGGSGIAFGAKYYFDPYNPKKVKGYAGLMLGGAYGEFFMQIPVGMSYTGKRGFDLKLGFSGIYFPSYSEFGVFPELTLGWRF